MPAKSKAQQRFFGMVHAYQKGELKSAPKSVKKAAGSMTKKASKDFAKTKHKGLPEKVDERAYEDNEEFFTSGLMAAASKMTLDQLHQRLQELEAQHEQDVLSGMEPETLDDLEMEIETLVAYIEKREREAHDANKWRVDVAEDFKQLTFKTFLQLDEADDQAVSQQELELRQMIMQLAQLVAKDMPTQPAPQQSIQQKPQQRKRQTPVMRSRASKQQKLQQSLRQANQLGRPVQTEGLLPATTPAKAKAKQTAPGAFRAGLGTLGQTFGQLGRGIGQKAQDFGAASPVGKLLRGAAERWAEKRAGAMAKDMPAVERKPQAAAPVDNTLANLGQALQAARDKQRPVAKPARVAPAAKPTIAPAAARNARAAQMSGAAQQAPAANPMAALTQNITQSLTNLPSERRAAAINTAIAGLTAGKRNTPQNLAVAKRVRELLSQATQGA